MALSLNNPFLRSVYAVLLLQPLLIAAAGDGATPLIDKVRNATAQYVDINAAFTDGFVVGTPCVSGPESGAMGVHLVHADRIQHLVLDATKPQALIYEPMADGAAHLGPARATRLTRQGGAARCHGEPEPPERSDQYSEI